jgi:hypothetical protein
MLGIADEIDAFKSKKEMTQRRGSTSGREPTKSAEGILDMMRTSSATRFPEIYKNVRISYPRYRGSTIQHLTVAAKKDIAENGIDSRHYVSGPLATWEVNPRVKGPEAFTSDYREDPVMARAKYECKPSRAINPYFRNRVALDSAFISRDTMPLTVTYQLEGTGQRQVWVPRYVFAPDFFPVRGAVYAMHGDLAISGDRAGIAMAHVVRHSEHETIAEDEFGATYTVRETRPHVKVDFVISYTSDPSTDPAREIQIRWARQLCFELIRRGFNISRFSFDGFQCLSGDVEIPLLDGTSRKLRELVGAEPFWVYSVKNGRVVPGLCTKAWRTGYRTDMVEVELDNGETVRATSDHLFMLRDGTYRPASSLQPGDSLMPLYRRLRQVSQSTVEYEQIWHPEPDGSGKHWRFTHSMVSHHAYGKLPRGWVTHHKNINALDNRPENLEQMTNAAHAALHNMLSQGRHFSDLWADPEWSAAHRRRISRVQSEVQRGKTGPQSRRYRKDLTFEMIEEVHRLCLTEGVVPTRAEVQRRLGCTQDALYLRVRAAGYRSWKAFRDAKEGVPEKNLYQRAWQRRRKNHTVTAVRPGPPEEVYDLQVDEYHNFAIGAGIFVHNSRDSMQILETKGIQCDRVSTDMSGDPWRNLRDIVYEGRLTIPAPAGFDTHPDPVPFLLRDELYGLTRMPSGRVDHPADLSKDEADALACAVFGAVQCGGAEDDRGERAHFAPPRITVGRVFDLPLGANPATLFEREIPSPF